MLDRILMFLRSNPELRPAIWLLGGYLGLYLVMLLASWIALSVRWGEPPRPFMDRIVHIMLFWFFFALSVLTVLIVLWLYRNPLYFPVWYHYLTYAVFFMINLLLLFGLIPKVRAR